ncbi:MAG: hypothetical protein KAQ98_10450 [Bacteriovoracaceae bacterium]|nr:hypothetical protein [Bacteriovoracaceae bacterium]
MKWIFIFCLLLNISCSKKDGQHQTSYSDNGTRNYSENIHIGLVHDRYVIRKNGCTPVDSFKITDKTGDIRNVVWKARKYSKNGKANWLAFTGTYGDNWFFIESYYCDPFRNKKVRNDFRISYRDFLMNGHKRSGRTIASLAKNPMNKLYKTQQKIIKHPKILMKGMDYVETP